MFNIVLTYTEAWPVFWKKWQKEGVSVGEDWDITNVKVSYSGVDKVKKEGGLIKNTS